MPKMLRSNDMWIDYAMDSMNGGTPFGIRDIAKRPLHANRLVTTAVSTINRIRNAKNGNNR